ncbi:DNA glycosylase domain protein [Mycobacterium kansasii 824]|nr:DNA glycosylase domain protein [Mycobacterium kansasii 824]
MHAVTGPLVSRLVRQIVPSPGTRKQGSPRPRRNGARVCPKPAARGM